MNANREKFQALLRELFQFDCADLDFGIYRIMNYKRDVVEKFITKDLQKAISDELDRGALADQSQAAKELKEITKRISDDFGKNALDADGNLAEAYRETPLGKKYLDLKAKTGSGRGREAIEAVIFNHLYSFFSRYYQDGDFISKRRYSRRQKYAIPYNGEEVHFCWANNDQYYVKTAEHFTRYAFTSKGVTVQFEIQAADVEQNNIKGDKRFFLPRCKDTVWNENAGLLTIPFEYRPLTEQEEIAYGKKNQQETINAKAVEDIPKQLKKAERALLAIKAERRKNPDDEPITLLEHHLRQYTRSNTSDFFIHKDLKGFLSRELDFYLKNEVLNLDEMEVSGEGRAEGWFQIMCVMKAVGNRIIEFLAQIENFQKMLWEKRKFITETQYCITVGNIDKSFYPEIAEYEAQWGEWKELFHIDEEQDDLFINGRSRKEKRIAFLKAHSTLVLDTKHFGQEFVDRLLAGFDNLDVMTDGLLIHSENFQALSQLHEKYREQVKCVYIDPPYNAQSSEILYKNNYKHSSWLSLIQDRVITSRPLLKNIFVHITAIDEVENMRLGLMYSDLFQSCEDTCVSIVHNPTGQQGNNFSFTHEFAHFIYPENINCIGLEDRDDPMRESEPDIRPLRNVSSGKDHLRQSAANCFYPIFIKEGKIIGFGDVCADDFHPKSKNIGRDDGIIEVYPIDPSNEESKWVFARDTVESILQELTAEYDKKKKVWDVIRKKSKFRYKSLWEDKRYSANSWGSVVLNSILPNNPFKYPKSIYTVRDCVDAGLNNAKDGTILDYFAGSGTTGHAVIMLNREDGGKRKYILVEMGEYFNTVLLPRIKKVTFSPDWKDGKPARMASKEEVERSPRIVKYIRLESYEDALNNIQFDEVSGQAGFKFDDYLLKYMLHWEARKSETLLNVEKLASPFSYTLHIHWDGQTAKKIVDIPETFNYLLGLHVTRRQAINDKDRRYLVYRGCIDHREIAVIWRETEGWTKADFERDKKFVAAQKLTEGADEVFVNGDSFIPNARALEPVFKACMFSPVEA